VLHEMMHRDTIVYKANGDWHIKDLQMRMRPIEPTLLENDKTPWHWYRVYGAMYTKILARVDDRNLGSYITTNSKRPYQEIQKIVTQNRLFKGIVLIQISGHSSSICFRLVILVESRRQLLTRAVPFNEICVERARRVSHTYKLRRKSLLNMLN
jgi:hypothetical protein